MTTNSEQAIKLTTAELKAEYAALKDAAKKQHDPATGKFEFQTFAQFKSQYNIDWDFAHPNDADAAVPTTTVLKIADNAIDALEEVAQTQDQNTKTSKMSLARAIFQQELDEKGPEGLIRKNILARFIKEADCTQHGANTYYNTLRSEAGLVHHK